MALLSVSGISKKIEDEFVLKDVLFTQEYGMKIAIAGETGSGKTTLLKMIAGLEQPDTGIISFQDKRVKGSLEQLIPGHPEIAYLSQHFELRNNYRVHEILAYADELPAGEAAKLYRICRIDHLMNRRTDQLSGGEKQRIALARLLSAAPRLLLLDEPFSNLDAIHKNIIKSVITDISDELKISLVMVSHDAPDVLSWADKILILKSGIIVQEGSPMEVYHQPVNEYCAGLMGEYSHFDTTGIFMHTLSPGPGNRKLFLRPEYWDISEYSGEDTLTGTVEQVRFWGAYYTLDVKCGNQSVRVRTNQIQVKTGDTINMAFSYPRPWYL
jgi:iron(III) transport system ATP-binding protein